MNEQNNKLCEMQVFQAMIIFGHLIMAFSLKKTMLRLRFFSENTVISVSKLNVNKILYVM